MAKTATKMTLAALTEESQALHDLIAEACEANEGDLTSGGADVILDKWFAEIGGQIDAKLDGYAYVIDQLNANAEALKSEEERISKRRKSEESNAARMKKRLSDWLQQQNMPKHKTLKHSFTIVGGRDRVEIDPNLKVETLPPQFRIVEVRADKTAIGDALKAGKSVIGCAMGKGDPYLLIR